MSVPEALPPLPRDGGDALILGAGARSPSGLTALQVTMSARARKLAPRPSHMIDKEGEPISMARLASIADDVFGLARFVALGGPALTQAAAPWIAAGRSTPGAGIPLFLALPSRKRPGFDPALLHDLLAALEERARVPLDVARSHLITQCRAGGVLAFQRALELLRRDEVPAVLVGGIDSYFDPDLLEHLDRELRLHTPSTENGMIPGEGAAFVLLARRRRASSLEPLGRVLAAAVEDEPHPYGAAEPCLAEGITAALRRASAVFGPGARRVPWALTDVANERHRVEEWMYAFGRNFGAFTPEVIHDQPLLKTGDVGAASAALLTVIAVTQWQTGCAPGDAALLALHSDGAERGALALAAEATPGGSA